MNLFKIFQTNLKNLPSWLIRWDQTLLAASSSLVLSKPMIIWQAFTVSLDKPQGLLSNAKYCALKKNKKHNMLWVVCCHILFSLITILAWSFKGKLWYCLLQLFYATLCSSTTTESCSQSLGFGARREMVALLLMLKWWWTWCTNHV